MEENPLADLIDQYLQGQISAEDDQVLKKRIASDPEAAKMMEDSQLAYRALQLQRQKQLKAKLQALDRPLHQPSRRRPVWLIVSLCILGGLSFYLYMSAIYFTSESVAARNIVSYQTYSTQTNNPSETNLLWKNAELDFRKGEFQNALLQYQTISADSDPTTVALAQWNILMAELALRGIDLPWTEQLEGFKTSSNVEVAQKAEALSKCLNSGYYRFFSRGLYQNLSSIKPRLI